MKENPIPTKDLKTGVKVVSLIGESLFNSVKPTLKREANRNLMKIFAKLTPSPKV